MLKLTKPLTLGFLLIYRPHWW